MVIQVWIYKRFDNDLLSLVDSGYNVRKMMRDALIAYANGNPFKIYIDTVTKFNSEEKHGGRIKFTLNSKKTDHAAAIDVLNSLRSRYRSNFCKMVLRNALLQQNLTCYFIGQKGFDFQRKNLGTIDVSIIDNLVNGEHYRELEKQMTILGEEYTVTHDTTQDMSLSGPKGLPSPASINREKNQKKGKKGVPKSNEGVSDGEDKPRVRRSDKYRAKDPGKVNTHISEDADLKSPQEAVDQSEVSAYTSEDGKDITHEAYDTPEAKYSSQAESRAEEKRDAPPWVKNTHTAGKSAEETDKTQEKIEETADKEATDKETKHEAAGSDEDVSGTTDDSVLMALFENI